MDTPLDTLIANEQAKIELLRAKVRECEHRIAVLRSMRAADDDLDAALSKKVSVARVTAAVESDLPSLGAADASGHGDSLNSEAMFPKKALGGTALKLLRFAGTTDKSIDQFASFASQNGITRSRQGIRAFLHQYKTVYQLLTSDRDGHFRLSDLGVAYLASLDKGGAISAR